MSWTHSLVFPIVLIGTIFTALDGAAQLQITSPANNSLAVEGSTITISVSADPSVQIVEVDGDTPLPAVQVGSGSGQFTLTIPTTIPAGLYNLTAVGTNTGGVVESAPVTIDVEPQYVPTGITVNRPWQEFPQRESERAL